LKGQLDFERKELLEAGSGAIAGCDEKLQAAAKEKAMRSRPFHAAIVFLCLLSSCCGTVCNLVSPDREKTYGGVSFDLQCIEKMVLGEPASGPLSSAGSGEARSRRS
jgi:hypothetical protein